MARTPSARAENQESLMNSNISNVQPKMKLKSKERVFHHLFKCELANMKKNVSWQKFNVDLKDTPHIHWFHTVNSLGLPEQYTPEVGGHFHKVDWSINEQGEFVAKCGPALKRISKRGRNGQTIIKIVPVSWLDKHVNDEDPESEDTKPVAIVDNHTHEMVYQNSEELLDHSIKSVVQKSESAPRLPDGLNMSDRDRAGKA